MKKALALVLALVLALSLGVSAFAVDFVTLKPADPETDELVKVELIDFDENPTIMLYSYGFENYPDPDVYYFAVTPATDGAALENVAVSANGAVSAKVFDYDPEKYVAVDDNGDEVLTYHVSKVSAGKEVETYGEGMTYEEAVALAKYIKEDQRNSNYKVFCDQEVVIVELTVPVNTSAAYKEGSVKVTGVEVVGKKKTNVSATLKFINDVTIFDYEEVKYCATEDEVLYVGVDGYSDYLTAKNGYLTPDLKDPDIAGSGAMVVSTTAFRAIQGKDLTVDAIYEDGNARETYLSATIKGVAAGQKGVNFLPFVDLNEDKDGKVIGLQFGFVGEQVVASDFVVKFAPELNYFGLRELFGKKVEEEDVITYYVLKDGKVYDSFTVDYMTVDYNEVVELEINGKAGDTLGMYEIVLEVPAAPEAPAEENPNTGAESVIGVVAAMAVVSVAAAAAVSLKK